MVANQRPSSLFSRPIFTTIVSGTDNSIPTVPSNQPQNIKDTNTTSVDRPTPLPIYLGSIIFPIIVLIDKYPAATKPLTTGPCVTSASKTGGTAAIIEPIHYQDV